MLETTGDIFDLAEGAYIGIPTNQVIKYQTPRGELTMGAGLALAAKKAFPELPIALAARIRAGGNVPYDMGIWCREDKGLRRTWGVLSVPTKTHWHAASEIGLIRLSLLRLVTLVETAPITRQIFLPELGCGAGGLSWSLVVRPMFLTCCLSDQFTVVKSPFEKPDREDEDRQKELFT